MSASYDKLTEDKVLSSPAAYAHRRCLAAKRAAIFNPEMVARRVNRFGNSFGLACENALFKGKAAPKSASPEALRKINGTSLIMVNEGLGKLTESGFCTLKI
jgi:hypothetical protein